MTIKQQGGIFGRNPTFNNLTIDGSLTGISDLTISGDLIVSSGQGIDFSATSGTGTSELFSDYEEGTYDVELWDGSASGNKSPTTTTGYYTKIGNVVTCTFSVLANIDTTGMTATNVLYMTIPFASAQASSGSIVYASMSARKATGEGQIVPTVGNGAGRARFYGVQADNAVGSIRPAEITSGVSDLSNFCMTYIAS